ncbi:MAG TPA: methylated-DNA--[protein]-cysteine S-methyltransferase [Chitinophagaceae bacterium]|nr:methylated-DNA--[protein]-cysteine S-methyltransferase [Chitinophagaceae bacterium]
MTIWTKNDEKETIYYELFPFKNWQIGLAHSSKGLCYLGFETDTHNSKEHLQKTFPKNTLQKKHSAFLDETFSKIKAKNYSAIPLHIKGTPFQIQIWKELLKIPSGEVRHYQDLHPQSSYARACGTAVGSNPISIIIPCHRVLQKSGKWQSYLWGKEIKKELLAMEGVEVHE